MSPAVLHLPGIAPASAARLWAMDPARWAAWLEDPRAGGVAMLASAEGRTRSYGYGDREAFREDLAALGGEALAVRGVRAVCFLAYEAAAWFERVPQPKAPVPCLAWLHQPSVSVHFDTAGATIVADSSAQAEEVARALKQGAAGRAPQCEVAWGSISAQPDPEGFCAAVRQVKDYIAAGDIFQANIARFFSAPFPQEGLEALYWRLRAVNPAPFAGFVRLGEGRYLLSSSPERLIRIQGRRIEARPIAGTRRRAQGARDRLLERELLLSEKERAEHVMLVDLVRNDLGRVCAYGTVQVDEMMTVERYATVQHIVSNVSGVLRKDIGLYEALAAVFPGGTITGCPKVRAMEIIHECEPRPRWAYTGSLGYIGWDGRADFNILIRTFWYADGALHWAAGAGIVADSVPERELMETGHKARGLERALGLERAA